MLGVNVCILAPYCILSQLLLDLDYGQVPNESYILR